MRKESTNQDSGWMDTQKRSGGRVLCEESNLKLWTPRGTVQQRSYGSCFTGSENHSTRRTPLARHSAVIVRRRLSIQASIEGTLAHQQSTPIGFTSCSIRSSEWCYWYAGSSACTRNASEATATYAVLSAGPEPVRAVTGKPRRGGGRSQVQQRCRIPSTETPGIRYEGLQFHGRGGGSEQVRGRRRMPQPASISLAPSLVVSSPPSSSFECGLEEK
jgi:hypothetical protein